MFYQSIRFKTALLYTAILALTLTFFGLVLYHNVDRGLRRNMDTLLISKADGISYAIDAYWEAANQEALEYGVKPEALRKRRNSNFAKVAQRWVEKGPTDPRLLDTLIRVFDTDGNTIASSKNMGSLSDIPRRDFITVLQGRDRLDTVASKNQPAREAFRIYTTPVFENEKVAYIVQAASGLSPTQIALNNLRLTLFVLIPITVMLAGALGVFLAKAALHPVDNMIKTIRQITAENLELKLNVPATRDEIRKLAETFNDMLGRLERAFTSQRRLFADLSHELKTPLTILKGELEIALKKIRSAEEYNSVLISSLEEINRIIKLAESLLLIARFDSEEALLKKEEFDIVSLLASVVDNAKGITELKQIKVSFKPPDRITLRGDRSQLKTLFLNILDNAVKYTSQGGRIDVAAGSDRSSAKILIRDTGIGIPKSELEHIFDRFYRVDKARSGDSSFGLGLSIAQSIAEAHGGKIEVESEEAKGTVFTVTLPLV
jgi:heavy metal sensor kinase